MTPHYLLDTNVCIEIVRGRHPGIQTRMEALSYGEAAICSIVWAELELRAHLSPKGYARARIPIEIFTLLPQWPFDRASAERYAELRANLQRKGQIIGGHDMQIAAIALVHGLILVTHNTREFARIPGLQLEDWQS
ncbi:MAG: type II toxin-antitoxin system VapC family toxin [Synechococcaceae cyanobacterium SM1_2_3]|nr:type II toxin-antitoxin system VapC family toxin [Synechococcaceae cyanobacterium SM1_2_3]